MSLRTMWKGVVCVGDQRIPVRLYAAASEHTVHFRLLHRKDRVPVRQQLVDPDTGEEIDRDEMRKGVEIEPGKFIMLEADDLEELEPQPSRDIEVSQFVPGDALRHTRYDRPYFLGPDGSEDAYWALVDLLEQTQREGIARWVMRKKEYVGSLSVHRDCLILVTLRFNDEVVSPDEMPAYEAPEPAKKEVLMARQLVDMLEDAFDPSEYRDEYNDRVRELIAKKAKGEKVTVEKPKRKEEAESLTEALKSSLEHAKKKKAAGKKGT